MFSRLRGSEEHMGLGESLALGEVRGATRAPAPRACRHP